MKNRRSCIIRTPDQRHRFGDSWQEFERACIIYRRREKLSSHIYNDNVKHLSPIVIMYHTTLEVDNIIFKFINIAIYVTFREPAPNR